MRRWALPVALLAAALLTVGWLQYQRSGSRTGFPAPDFTLPDLNGRLYSLSALRGNVVFLNLWATWCPPCRMEMPSMEVLYQRFKGRNFVMLAVSEDLEGAQSVAPFVRELGLTFPILLDQEGRLPPRYGVTGYPETFVIDPNGNVVKHHIGPAEWDSAESFAYFQALLEPAAVQQAGGSP